MNDQAFCPQCGSARLVGAAYCGTCGRKWDEAAPVAPAGEWVAPPPPNKRLRNIVVVLAVAVVALMAIGSLGRPRTATPAQQPVYGLEDLVTLKVTGCTGEAARGTVYNGNSVVVDVFVDVQFLDAKGVIIDNSLASVQGLRPSETGQWEALRIDTQPIDKCRGDVGNVFAQ